MSQLCADVFAEASVLFSFTETFSCTPVFDIGFVIVLILEATFGIVLNAWEIRKGPEFTLFFFGDPSLIVP